jgi:hypothetical protein
LVDHARPQVIAVAKGQVALPLTWAAYEPFEGHLAELLAVGIPPAELGGEPVPPWPVIVAVWLYGLTVYGDSAEALGRIVEDSDLSRFALKTLEMSRVLELWRESTVTPT